MQKNNQSAINGGGIKNLIAFVEY